jgi:hypothetical protein
VDVGIITYILSQATTNHEIIKELKNPKRSLKVYTTSSVFSDDGKTYVRLVKKTTSSRKTTFTPFTPVQSQGSQVTISPVQTFYKEEVPPASHNAVLSDMTPYMRHKLKAARRIRGGALSSGLLDRLTIGSYFGTWYALNIVYNSKFPSNVFACVFLICNVMIGVC